jgi:FtsZ-binding cell division protein ZapB
MDASNVYTIVAAVAGIFGGFVGGRRLGQSTAVGTAVDVVELLQVQVALLTEENGKKDTVIADLRARVEVLEGLVTQRAEVAEVHEEVRSVRVVIDRIAQRVGA